MINDKQTPTWGDIYIELESYLNGQKAPMDIKDVAAVLSVPESLIISFSELNPNVVLDKGRIYHRGTDKPLSTPAIIRSVLKNAETALSAAEIIAEAQKISPETKSSTVHTALYNLRQKGHIVRTAGKYVLVEREDEFEEDHVTAILALSQQLMQHATSLVDENKRLKVRLQKANEELKLLNKLKETMKQSGVIL